MKLLKYLEMLWKCKCRCSHDWELRKDLYLRGMPFRKGFFFRKSGYTRLCIFRCKRCNKVKRFRRWAYIGGTGAKHIICCTGSDCGCMGKPTDFVNCECGREFPSDEQIYEWYTKMKESYEKDMKAYMTKEDLT